MTRTTFATMLALMPILAMPAPLDTALRDFVRPSLRAMEDHAQALLRKVISDPDASHADKVLALHPVP